MINGFPSSRKKVNYAFSHECMVQRKGSTTLKQLQEFRKFIESTRPVSAPPKNYKELSVYKNIFIKAIRYH
jgi:hypothetical protein